MGYYFRKVAMVALLVVAYIGAAWADNLTVTVTRVGAGVADASRNGQSSLQQALSEYDLDDVEAVEVSAGRFEAVDWNWLNDKRYELHGLKRFVVTDGVESVADMPESDWEGTSWGEQLEELRVAKLRKVGRKAFYGCRKIVSVSLPVWFLRTRSCRWRQQYARAHLLGAETSRTCRYPRFQKSIAVPFTIVLGYKHYESERRPLALAIMPLRAVNCCENLSWWIRMARSSRAVSWLKLRSAIGLQRMVIRRITFGTSGRLGLLPLGICLAL